MKKLQKFYYLLALSSAFLLSARMYAQPGSLDPEFNTFGYVVHATQNAWTYPMGLAVGSEGEVFVCINMADTATTPPYYQSAVLKYINTGLPDLSFGSDGIASLNFQSYMVNIFLQSDGKILIAGQSWGNVSDEARFTLFRLNPDGSPDTGFGQNGMIIDTVGSWASDIHFYDDGKFLVAGAGYTNESPKSPFYLLKRLNPDGSPDLSFGIEGRVIVAIPGCTGISALGMEVQPDEKILMANEVLVVNRLSVALVRLSPEGVLDQGFGQNGIVIDSLGVSNGCYNLALLPDGKIMVPAYVYEPDFNTPHFAVFRYLEDGSADLTFHGTGHYVGNKGAAYDITLQSDGMILIAGNQRDASNIKQGVVARYHLNGEADTTFGVNGISAFQMESPTGLMKVCAAPEQKIIATGFSNEVFYPHFWRNTLTLRLNAAGVAVPETPMNIPFTLWPNPFGNHLTISGEGINESCVEVIATDGRVLVSFHLTYDKQTLNLEFLPAGIYHLRLIKDGVNSTTRIIKQ